MRIFLIFFLTLILGVAAGLGTALLRTTLVAWNGDPGGSAHDAHPTSAAATGGPVPKLVLEKADYDFGTMDSQAKGEHDFIFRNAGDAPLTLEAGATSCHCTLSRIENERVPPGESTRVTLTWTGGEQAARFHQTATILTNDPRQPSVTLTVSGLLTTILRADPDELIFSTFSSSQGARGEVRLLCALPGPLKTPSYTLSDPVSADHVQLSFEPLTAEQLNEVGEKDVQSGLAMRVTLKPGLPQGPFQQTILVQTGLESAPLIEVPVRGLVGGDIAIIGRGWDAESATLGLGIVSSKVGTQRRLTLVVRGPHRQTVRFRALPSQGEQLRVTLGETTEMNDTAATQTPLTVEIPKGSRPVNHINSDQGKPAEIEIETTHPEVPKLRIFVRFAVVE